MKCALIIPSWKPEDIFPSKTAGSQINYWQPLGTLYVAAVLQKAGHEVKFFNGAFVPHRELLRQVEDFSPKFIGLYSTAFGWNKAKKTAADLRTIFGKRAFFCAGGPYPIAVQGRCLEDAGEGLDAVVTGEGEHTVLKPWNGSRRGPATYKRRPVAVIMTARGCNRRCVYCFQLDKTRQSGIRFRSVGNVLAEIELCLRQGYREIKFLDDTFAADYNRAMRLTEEIRKRRLDFTWFASACVNQVDRPLLKAFRDAGCWAILFGAESGVQKNLNAIREGTTLEQIRAAVKTAQEVGLKVSTPFLFGIPGETYEEGPQDHRVRAGAGPGHGEFSRHHALPGHRAL